MTTGSVVGRGLRGIVLLLFCLPVYFPAYRWQVVIERLPQARIRYQQRRYQLFELLWTRG